MSPLLPHRIGTAPAIRGTVVATAVLLVCAPGAMAAQAEPKPLLPDLAPVVLPIASSVDQLIGAPVVQPIVEPVLPVVDGTVDEVEATVANVGATAEETVDRVIKPIVAPIVSPVVPAAPARPAAGTPASAPTAPSALQFVQGGTPPPSGTVRIDLSAFETSVQTVTVASLGSRDVVDPRVAASNDASRPVRSVPGSTAASMVPSEDRRSSPVSRREQDTFPPLSLLKQKFAPVGAPTPPAVADFGIAIPAPPVAASVVDRRRSQPRGPPLLEIPVRPD